MNPHANLVVFDGFMSPVFLQTSCRSLPLNISFLVQDLYSRLENLFDSLGLLKQGAGEIGLVGFSGGGRVALELMILDGQSSVPLYKLGAFIASPILNQRLTFDLLDDAFAPDTGGLTTMPYALSVAYHMVPSILRGVWGVLPEHIYALYKKNPPNFRQRVWNEFITVDLKDALAVVGISHGDLSDSLSWRSAYEHVTAKSFDPSDPCLTPEPLDARLDYISQRTVVVFSLILSKREEKTHALERCLMSCNTTLIFMSMSRSWALI